MIQHKTQQDKQEQFNRNEPPTSENRNTTQRISREQTLILKQKINLVNLKRVMNENITKKHRMENSQDGNRKIKSSTNMYINKKHKRIK